MPVSISRATSQPVPTVSAMTGNNTRARRGRARQASPLPTGKVRAHQTEFVANLEQQVEGITHADSSQSKQSCWPTSSHTSVVKLTFASCFPVPVL